MTDGISTGICKVENCDRSDRLALGYCGMHYQRFHKYGDPLILGTPHCDDRLAHGTAPKFCLVGDCGKPAKAKGMCHKHHARFRRTGSTDDPIPFACSVEGCKRKYVGGGYCSMHASRVRNTGAPGPVDSYPPKMLGPHEYVFITNPGGRQVMEHRHVMSLMIGRPLRGKENVHHLNGDKHDNRPENLELWSSDQPPGQRIEDKVKFAIEILSLYAPEMLVNPPLT